jgi:hypothetical protein
MIMIIFFLHLHTPKTPLVDGLKAIDWLGMFFSTSRSRAYMLNYSSFKVVCPSLEELSCSLLVFSLVV